MKPRILPAGQVALRRNGFSHLSAGGLAFINAALANIDRRSPLKYFLGSLVIGPFITLLLAVTREDEAGALRQVDLWTGRP